MDNDSLTPSTPLPEQGGFNEEDSMYCPKCGGCGFIGCDGIKNFLKEHVVGKTNCSNESMFIHEILDYLEEDDDITGVVVTKGGH